MDNNNNEITAADLAELRTNDREPKVVEVYRSPCCEVEGCNTTWAGAAHRKMLCHEHLMFEIRHARPLLRYKK